MDQYFEIVISGHLTTQWAAVFDGLEVICLAEGNTLIRGYLPDQAALYGVIMQLRDLGLTLISIERRT
ncbi:MAG TPA: hypothetical protein VGK87_16580 [Anaerolineae bacterium]